MTALGIILLGFVAYVVGVLTLVPRKRALIIEIANSDDINARLAVAILALLVVSAFILGGWALSL